MKLDPIRSAQRGPALHLPAEQRQSARHACGPEVTCRLLVSGEIDCWAVRVQNLSAGGISLFLDRVIPAGKVLTVEVHNQTRNFSCQRQIRVIYTLQNPSGGLMMGGAFCPNLTEQELEGLV